MSKHFSRILSFLVALAMLITPMAVLADHDAAILHGTVFRDENGSGTIDAGDIGLEGVTVTLFASDGSTWIDEFLTGSDGMYEFADLDPEDYVVEVEVLVGYNDTTPVTVPFTVDGSDPIPTADFGKEPLPIGSISGTVYNDVDRNREYNTGDIPLELVTLQLLDSEDALLDEVETDENGEYSFIELLPGSYTVIETDPTDESDPTNPIVYYSTTPNTVAVNLPTGDSMEVVVNFGDFIPDEDETKKLNLLIMKYFDIPLLDILELRQGDGWGYGNIAKAYFIAQLSGEPVAGIIAMREEMGWGNIMKTVLGRAGLKGYNLGLIVSGRDTPRGIENLMSRCELIETPEQAQELFAMGASNGAIKKACKLAQEVNGDYEKLVMALELLKDYKQKQVREMLQEGATIQAENTERNGNHGPPPCKGKNKYDQGCNN